MRFLFLTKLTTFSDRGASMVEYAFLVILIAIIAFAAVQILGTEVSSSFSQAADGFTTAG